MKPTQETYKLSRNVNVLQGLTFLVIGMAFGLIMSRATCFEDLRNRKIRVDNAPAVQMKINDGWVCPPSANPVSSVDFLLDMHQVPTHSFSYWENIENTREKLKEVSAEANLHLLHIASLETSSDEGAWSGFWLFQEGRLDIQAWKKQKFISLNWHTCQTKSGSVLRALRDLFRPLHMTVSRVTRGDGSPHVLYRMRTDTVSNIALIPNENEQTEVSPLTGKNVDICVNADEPSDDCFMLKHLQILDRKDSIDGMLEVVRTKNYGLCILNNRKIRYCEADVPSYEQEMLMPVMLPYELEFQEYLAGDRSLSLSSRLQIQLVDNGEGWINSYLLKRYSPLIGQIDILSHNPDVTTLSKKHLKNLDNELAFEDMRLKRHYASINELPFECSAADHSVDVFILNESELNAKTIRTIFNQKFYDFIGLKLKSGGRIVQRLGPVHRKDQMIFLKKFEQMWKEAGLRVIKHNKMHLTGDAEPSLVWIGQKI